VQSQASIKLPLFQKNMKAATLALDACGMFGTERTGLMGNMKATAYLGYGVVSIPLKTLTINNVAIICPLVSTYSPNTYIILINHKITL
jgi:hypothetical protein